MKPNGVITLYYVWRFDHASNQTTQTNVITGLEQRRFSIMDEVLPFNHYSYAVIAFTNVGSATSPIVNITTPEDGKSSSFSLVLPKHFPVFVRQSHSFATML